MMIASSRAPRVLTIYIRLGDIAVVKLTGHESNGLPTSFIYVGF